MQFKVMLAAVQQNWLALEFGTAGVKGDRLFMFDALTVNPKCLK
jgi:hypothetical protein